MKDNFKNGYLADYYYYGFHLLVLVSMLDSIYVLLSGK